MAGHLVVGVKIKLKIPPRDCDNLTGERRYQLRYLIVMKMRCDGTLNSVTELG